MRLAVAVATVLALAAAAPASARERLLADVPVGGLEAGGGWVSWLEADSQVFLHDGERTISHLPLVRELGTDAEGRGVGLSVGCSSAGRCKVRHRVLAEGRTSRLVVIPSNLTSVDEHHGSLLLGFRRRGHPRGIYLRRPGEDSGLERLSRLRPGGLSISSHAMSSLDGDVGLYAAGRNRPHRWRLLERTDDPYFHKDMVGAFRYVIDAQADGRFVYWIDALAERFENGEGRYSTTILRVDPGASHRHVQQFTPPRTISELAVTNGNVYYTDRGSEAPYEFRHPRFYPGGETVPVGG